ncbi:MAG: hypothetical protein ACLP6E_03315 [Acidimicrobiales bacterium]
MPSIWTDAPNPAFCPHHHCSYTSPAQVFLIFVVIVLVLVCLVLLVVVEMRTVLGEAALLLVWLRRDPILLLLISIVANGASFLAGVTLLR